MSDKPTMGFWNGAIIWHTDDLGNLHWGSPADRLARIAWEESRRKQAGLDQYARQNLVRRGDDGM